MNEFLAAAWSMSETVGTHLAGVSPTLLVAGLALHALKLAVRARAWQNVLRASFPERPVRYADAAVPYLAGTGAGAIVPFGGGEVLRVAVARTRLRCHDESEGAASTATLVGSLALERAFDVVVAAVVIALAASSGLIPNGVLHTRVGGVPALFERPLVAGVAGGVGLLAVAGGYVFRRRLATAGTGILRGLVALKRPRRYLTSVASWQLLSWVFRFAALVVLLEAFHVPAALAVAPVVLSLQLLASSVPVTPGGAGTQQALVAAALGSTAIVGFSAGAQAATMLVDVLLGSAALAGCGIRPRLRLLRAGVTEAAA